VLLRDFTVVALDFFDFRVLLAFPLYKLAIPYVIGILRDILGANDLLDDERDDLLEDLLAALLEALLDEDIVLGLDATFGLGYNDSCVILSNPSLFLTYSAA